MPALRRVHRHILLASLLLIIIFQAPAIPTDAQDNRLIYGNSIAGTTNPDAPATVYTFDGVPRELVTITAVGFTPGFVPTVQLISPDGVQIAASRPALDDVERTAATLTFLLRQAGEHTITVSSLSAVQGDFVLNLNASELPDTLFIDFGKPVELDFRPGDPPRRINFQLTPHGTTTLVLSSAQGFPFSAEIRDDYGQVVQSMKHVVQTAVLELAPGPGNILVLTIEPSKPALGGSINVQLDNPPPPDTSGNDGDCVNDMAFISDVTFPDGTPLQVDVPFVKTWRVQNTGTCHWAGDYAFIKADGDRIIADPEAIFLPDIAPGFAVDLSMTLALPSDLEAGTIASAAFQMLGPDGQVFGERTTVTVIATPAMIVPNFFLTQEPLATEGRPKPTATPQGCTNEAAFVEDVTIPDDTSVVPGERFTKVWRFTNTGTCTWDDRYQFVKTEGDAITVATLLFAFPTVETGEVVDFNLELILDADTPEGAIETIYFEMRDPMGIPFGPSPFVQVVAEP